MKYVSDAPKIITHEVVLEEEDVRAAVLAWLLRQEDCNDKLQGVSVGDLNIVATTDGCELSIVWQTNAVAVAVPRSSSPMAQAGPMLAEQQAGNHRQGRFAVINDQGTKARTGPVVETFGSYDEADTYRHEQPMVSDRASIVWLLKSGSRYNPDQRTFAVDDDDDEED